MVRSSARKVKVSLNDFVNKDTGECMSSQYEGSSYMTMVDNTHVIIESKEFYIIDTAALSRIECFITDSDFGKLSRILPFVYGDMNLLSNKDGYPYQRDEIRVMLGMSVSRFSTFISKLKRIGVVYLVDGYKNRKRVRYIMINPTLARRRKRISKNCMKAFDDLSRK